MSDVFFQRFPLVNPQWKTVVETHLEADSSCRNRILAATEEAYLPAGHQVFAALDHTPPEKVKVVIVGQDPYPTPGDAHGLAFSVEHGKPPRSLINIFAEIQRDYPDTERSHANLSDWAGQGVLLLNRSLTVKPGQAGSHSKSGWDELTGAILRHLAQSDNPLVLMLWGTPARKAAGLFKDRAQTLILESRHPSPLSYNRPADDSFKECGHFRACNEFLISAGIYPIIW